MGTTSKGKLKTRGVKKLTKKDKQGNQGEVHDIIYVRGTNNGTPTIKL